DELEQKVRERTLELQQSNQTLRMISECNQALVRATDEINLIREICGIIRELGGYRMAWVGYAENDAAKSVRTIAAVGPDAGYLDEARITWADEAHGRGPTGACIRTGTIRVCRDFKVDPDLDPWREQALQRGYRSSIALPLISAQRVFGALTIYAEQPDVFDESQRAILTELAGDLAFGIAILRTRSERDQAAKVAEDRARQLQALAAELGQTEQRERQRLAKVLHDHLQQLLVGAKFNLATIREIVETPEGQKTIAQVFDILDEAIKSARSLTADLSSPALYEKGLSVGLEWLSRQMKQKYGLKVAIKTDPEAELAAEPVCLFLFEAVRELLFNVVKHAQTDGAAVETVRCNPDQIRVTVSDQGAGFDPEQLESERRAAGQFGLFSIRERLNYLGGKMETESAPGHGSRFILTAPARLTPVEGGVRISAEEPRGASISAKIDPEPGMRSDIGRKIRVLLADDHPVMRQGLTLVLQGEPDIEIVGEAEDGQEAVKWSRHLQPDVILMDVSMPRVNGIEATRQILTELPATRIIGLSMHVEDDMAAAMREAGAVAYLTKGGPVEDLIAAVRACVGIIEIPAIMETAGGSAMEKQKNQRQIKD
ncbi:MAG: response regulator, partial [Desulfobacteraceae bacterium]